MRVLFIVQGEGRGHMTQALVLEEILNKAGHQVTDIILGTSNRRQIPEYFTKKTEAKIHKVESPNFYYDKEHKSINLKKTFIKNVVKVPHFLRELKRINSIVKASKADTVVNFYDVLGGYYFLFYRPQVKRICIAHQYLASHSQFPFSKEYPIQKQIFKFNNRVTSFFAHKRLALSFKDLPHEGKELHIIPPLIRKEVLELKPTNGDYILAYVVNKGYGFDILKWHEKNQNIKVHCFWDNYEKPVEWSPHKNITFYHIHDKKFIKHLANCTCYVSTAGFESISEAMYLGKSVMMVPVKSQYEQICNALDAEIAGAGIITSEFDLSQILSFIHSNKKTGNQYKSWVNAHENIILKEIEDFVPYKTAEEKIDLKIEQLIFNNR